MHVAVCQPFQQNVCLCRCSFCSGRAQHYSVLLTARIDLLFLFMYSFYELQTLQLYCQFFNMFCALTHLFSLLPMSYSPHLLSFSPILGRVWLWFRSQSQASWFHVVSHVRSQCLICYIYILLQGKFFL